MSDPAKHITDQMQDIRRHVGEDVRGIVQSARTLTDWRRHVRRHPWACMGLAGALGFLLVPKKKPVVTGDAKELLDMLRKRDLAVTPSGLSRNHGLLKSLAASAGPLLVRTAMGYVANSRAAQSGRRPQAGPTPWPENVSGP